MCAPQGLVHASWAAWVVWLLGQKSYDARPALVCALHRSWFLRFDLQCAHVQPCGQAP
jgi:hypothetical protein